MANDAENLNQRQNLVLDLAAQQEYARNLKKQQQAKRSKNAGREIIRAAKPKVKPGNKPLESVKNLAVDQVNKQFLSVVFKSLWSVILFAPAILYLNVHSFLRLLGFKKFAEFTFAQKMEFWIANLIFLILLIVSASLVVIIVQMIDNPTSTVGQFIKAVVE